jgi:hypothetical protein
VNELHSSAELLAYFQLAAAAEIAVQETRSCCTRQFHTTNNTHTPQILGHGKARTCYPVCAAQQQAQMGSTTPSAGQKAAGKVHQYTSHT